jgi:ABC-type multidrug transport system ATPase subunit
VVEFKNVSKSFGDRLLIDDLSFLVPAGAIVGIIGPNGAGKSTLFKMLIGKEKPDQGEINVGPTVKLAYVDQSRDALTGNHNVFQEVSGGSDILNINGIEIQSRAYIGRFNFKGPDQQKLVGTLSGGERGRLHLAKTLLQGGNVLLLDEPSNDLDIETLRALEDALLEFPGNAFVISHDRWFLDRIATHILAFEGDSHVEFFAGNYREYEEDKKRRLGEGLCRPGLPRQPRSPRGSGTAVAGPRDRGRFLEWDDRRSRGSCCRGRDGDRADCWPLQTPRTNWRGWFCRRLPGGADQARASRSGGEDHQAGDGHARGDHSVRGRAAGAGDDGPPEHRPRF